VAGIVDEDVDRLEGVRNEVGQLVHAGRVGNIKLDRKRVVAHLGGELAKGFPVAVGEHDPSSAFEQRLRDRSTHATGSPRHDGIPVRCFSHYRSPVGGSR